jgi:hypothetical protein
MKQLDIKFYDTNPEQLELPLVIPVYEYSSTADAVRLLILDKKPNTLKRLLHKILRARRRVG